MTEFAPMMRVAIAEAEKAAARGEVPVGAALVDPERQIVLAQAGNQTRTGSDPTAHAEMLVIREACARLGRERLNGLSLYVTLEPCAMCAGAIAAARISRLVYGASDPKSGGVEHGARVFDHAQSHHRPEIIAGVAETECAALLKAFFEARR